MKYRTKLCLALVAAAFISCVLALAIVYTKTKKELFNELRSEVTTIAATTALLVDGDLLSQVQTTKNQSSIEYAAFQEQLQKARDANQRHNIFVKFIYTINPSANDSQVLLFGVDADIDPEPIGEPYIYSDAQDILSNPMTPFANHTYIRDPWGLWLTGFAPILNSKGQYVATLGADLNAQRVNATLDTLLFFGLTSLSASFGLALLLGFILSSMVSRPLAHLCETVQEIGKGNLDYHTHLNSQDEFNDLAIAIDEMTQGLKERERLKMNFTRYVSKYVLEKILSSDALNTLEGKRKKITVLFADIRQFTNLAESLSPEDVVAFLNEYFEKMLDVVFHHLGTLDKFIGDGMMVEFGAPLDDPLQEKHAIDTALQMQEELKNLCAKWAKEGKPQIKVGIGIHTGYAIIGNIGTEKRMEFTAIGYTVNIAARLEQATKILKTPILVSESTIENIKDLYIYENLGPIALPDQKEKIQVFAILGSKHPLRNEHQQKLT